MKQSEFEGLQQIQAGNFPRALFADILSLPKDSWHILNADKQFATADKIMQMLRANGCEVDYISLVIDNMFFVNSLYSEGTVCSASTEVWVDRLSAPSNHTKEVKIRIYYRQPIDFKTIQENTAPIDLLDPDQKHTFTMSLIVTKRSKV